MPTRKKTALMVHQEHITLLNSYCHALDTRDWKLLSSLFHHDVIFTAQLMGLPGEPPRHGTRLEGREVLLSSLQEIWSHLAATHHMLSNYVVDPGDDATTAQGSCYVRAYHAGARENSHLFEESLGRFDFETVRENGRWQIRQWNEHIAVMLGTREVFGHR